MSLLPSFPLSGYYDGATDLYEYGWGQNFHFARYYPGEAFYQAIARHEHYLALSMGLKKKMRVLDVGCGVGGPAREIARFAGVEIVGLNNNEYQVDRANKYTQKAGLEGQVSCELVLALSPLQCMLLTITPLLYYLFSCQGRLYEIT
jgi:sterol 24-C-methyltransferase